MGWFFKENNPKETSKYIIWDTAKAVFRRIAITYTIKKNREKKKKYEEIKKEM